MSPPLLSHVEWRCRDVGAARAFLEALFDWRFTAFGRRYVETVAGWPRVALMAVAKVPPAGACQGYVAVDALDEVLTRAEALGADVAEAPVVIAGYGRYARIVIPGGSVMGLFEALPDEASGIRSEV